MVVFGSHDGRDFQDMKGRIVVYSIVGCPHCLRAKSHLQEMKLPYTDVSVDRFPSYVHEWLKERTGKTSVPQIFFNSHHIGGNAELETLMTNETELNKLLRDVYENDPPGEGDKTAPLLPHPGEANDIPSIDGEEIHCEIDEYAALVKELQESGIVKTHKKGWICSTAIKASFSGKDFVDWITKKKQVSRERAVEMGQNLVARKFGLNAEDEEDIVFKDDADSLYRLGGSESSRGLNSGEISRCVQRPAGEVAEDIRKLILRLYSDYLSPDGRSVDYKGIKASEAFKAFKKLTVDLQRVDLEKIGNDEKLAFFINIYNALVIHGNVEKGTPSNLWQRYKFFSQIGYDLGGHFYSLNDIENGVLRGNRESMATLYRTPFSKGDPRLRVALPQAEPRIHFALNCGAKSCPPIKTFSADEVQRQLDVATESYLESDEALRIDVEKATVHLSMLFKWYEVDFGKDKTEVLEWIHEHIGEEAKKQQFGEVMKNESHKVKYITYDWGNNAKD